MLVRVQELVGRPGRSERLDRSVDPLELTPVEAGEARWDPSNATIRGPLELALRLESVVDGILVRGTVDLDLVMACSRCLDEIVDEATLGVAELFHDPRRLEVADYTEGEDYLLEHDLVHLDLAPALRDAVTLAVPHQPRCREDCAGLCPTCGANRDAVDCGHGGEPDRDPRWAVLADLDLPDG